jgi:signal transduction histidine kinase
VIPRKRHELVLRQTLELQEAERRRIARELHDEIGQALAALKMNLQTIQRSGPSGVESALGDSIRIVEHAICELRDLSHELRPAALDDLGLVPALRWQLDRQAKRSAIAAQLDTDGIRRRFPAEIESACFRVAQEALANVARHAGARRVWLELAEEKGTLRLVVRDDGIGFEVDTALRRAGAGECFGLIGMRERLDLAGGTLEVESGAGIGTTIRACFPVPLETDE